MRRSSSSNNRGLTLLELVVVIMILTALAALVIPNFSNVQEEAFAATTRQNLLQLQETIMNHYAKDMRNVVGMLPPLPAANPLDSSRRDSTTNVAYPQLHFLFVNPLSYNPNSSFVYTSVANYDLSHARGWNGPYFLTGRGTYPDITTVHPHDIYNRTWSQLGFTATYGLAGDSTVRDAWGSPIVIRVYDFVNNPVNPLRTDNLFTLAPNDPAAPALTIANAVLVSAGEDHDLNTQNDNVTLKLQ